MHSRYVAALFAMAVPLGAAFSQSPRWVTVRVDNDAFDFWMAPWNRPDEEYTSGVHVDYDGGDAPRWSREFLRGRLPCFVGAHSCRTSRSVLGQNIYTPSVGVDGGRAAPGSRPNAGWLFVSQTARALNDDRATDLTLTTGVTGPPSLARYMQALAHRAAPTFNRPTDWSHQLAFEPGVIVRYAQQRRFVVGETRLFGADVLPRAAVSIGNVSTAAEAGVDARLGWRLPHPWLLEPRRFSATLSAGASERAVARDLFLDGNTFARSDRVGHEPFVTSANAGVEIRYDAFLLGYRAQSDSRSYARGPKWHPWASLIGGVTFDR